MTLVQQKSPGLNSGFELVKYNNVHGRIGWMKPAVYNSSNVLEAQIEKSQMWHIVLTRYSF